MEPKWFETSLKVQHKLHFSRVRGLVLCMFRGARYGIVLFCYCGIPTGTGLPSERLFVFWHFRFVGNGKTAKL